MSSVIHAYRAWIARLPAQPRLLVVDDDPAARRFVDRVLLDAGYHTAVALDGPHARDLAVDTPFDMLVTDLVMPGMPGDELAHELRERLPELRVLYLTGYADRLFTQRGQLCEGEAFLEKPLTTTALLEAVAFVLYGRLFPPGGPNPA